VTLEGSITFYRPMLFT